MDIGNIVKTAPTQTGRDPEVEKKAEKYAGDDWKFTMYPVLKEVYGENLDHEVIAAFQEALYEHKYNVLETSSDKKHEAKKANLRFSC